MNDVVVITTTDRTLKILLFFLWDGTIDLKRGLRLSAY